MNTPIVLHLYDPRTNEKTYTATAHFIPWKMQKRAIRLYKALGKKDAETFEETDIDELTGFVLHLFHDDNLTIDRLDEQADTGDMFTVIRTVVNRSRAVMDPTSPPGA